MAQISFEEGYFIKDSGQKTECLIKNNDWKSNPREFQYRLVDSDKTNSISIRELKEFGVYNTSKYIKSEVNIDKSTDDTNKLTDNKEPEFEINEVFLRVLVEGKISLYEYTNGNSQRFFYGSENKEIQPLVYKRYKLSSNKVTTNSSYKKQLWDALRCDGKPLDGVQDVSYNRKELVDLFKKYNACVNSGYIEFYKKRNKVTTSLNIRSGINSTALEIYRAAQSFKNVDFGTKLSLRLGAEVEFLLPFNANKWAVISEIAYFKYSGDEELDTAARGAKIDFNSIEIPIGVRHYFYLSNNSSLFLNASIIFNLSSSEILYENADSLTIQQSNSLAFGLGYRHKRYALEFRNGLKRTVVPHFESSLGTMSLIFGYTLF
ncbi:tRNA modification GTPase [Aestuariibaculum suncheonense]|uniref:tRNA modification GTPase n=2 Tax=Aestuariibaculum suncheonense TaxID=1028745 RepID=A0A8J6QL87_9FLAO|nr:tRNA modification GTPase [Aestuariibaculum suncheonense]